MRGYFLGERETPCPYIDDEVFISENYMFDDVGEDEIDFLLSRGYRHFGHYFFRPVCASCHMCVPIRIPVEKYVFSRNAKRLFRKNRKFEVRIVSSPSATQTHFRLYRKHSLRFEPDGNPSDTFESFAASFFENYGFSKTMEIFDGDRLIAVTHLDWGNDSVSAVYCYYDTDYTDYSPGRFSIYKGMEFAAKDKKKYYYLGYYVRNNVHMSYKAGYRPHEFLLEEDMWVEDTGEDYEFRPKYRLY